MLEAVAARNGLTLDLVDEEVDDFLPAGGEDGEGPDPKDVTARLVAHIGHRIPGVRKIEKRLEGRDKTSGIWSDAMALGAIAYARNSEAIETLIKDILAGSKKPGRNRPNGTGDTTAIDFGVVGGSNGNGE